MFSDVSIEAVIAAAIGLTATGLLAYLYYAPRWRSDETPAISKRNYLATAVSSFVSGFAVGIVLVG